LQTRTEWGLLASLGALAPYGPALRLNGFGADFKI